jgi:hypothetical protein
MIPEATRMHRLIQISFLPDLVKLLGSAKQGSIIRLANRAFLPVNVSQRFIFRGAA